MTKGTGPARQGRHLLSYFSVGSFISTNSRFRSSFISNCDFSMMGCQAISALLRAITWMPLSGRCGLWVRVYTSTGGFRPSNFLCCCMCASRHLRICMPLYYCWLMQVWTLIANTGLANHSNNKRYIHVSFPCLCINSSSVSMHSS